MKKLEVGITKIAEVMVADPETQQPIRVPLYYGNHIEIGNALGMVSKQQYYSCLDTFLNTEEGQEYERPDKDKIEADIALLHNREKGKSIERKEINKKQKTEEKKLDSVPSETELETSKAERIKNERSSIDFHSKPKPLKKKQNSMMELFDLGADNAYLNKFQSEKAEEDSKKIPGKYITHKPSQITYAKKEAPDKQKKETKHENPPKKQRNIFKLTTVLLMLLCSVMGYYIFMNKTKDSLYEVIQLVHDVSKGEKITEDDFEKVEIPISQYEKISSSTFIDSNGKEKEDSLILYANRNQIEGKYASGDLKEGDYLTTSSYASLSLDASNTVHMLLDDGTEVKIKATELDAGKSSVHLYAVISSSDGEGKITNTAVDLGEISFEGKALADILNQDGISLIQNNGSKN